MFVLPTLIVHFSSRQGNLPRLIRVLLSVKRFKTQKHESSLIFGLDDGVFWQKIGFLAISGQHSGKTALNAVR
ncbi:hypothetical protein SAMN05444359_10183 [Neolewinella agarilytica]|uniref:Uncharacterized protein n=1 Tax=Neolewinella agarilytica TaxID=478744 RepID=A0A1H8YYI2_9BACT|nr:hypothetical protein SAMN05444359_10183 [Neolewinella agarilytica]